MTTLTFERVEINFQGRLQISDASLKNLFSDTEMWNSHKAQRNFFWIGSGCRLKFMASKVIDEIKLFAGL